MKAVILAGGKGSRLAQHTKDLPKPMLPLGGIPMLEHQVNLLKKYNITEIIILINYLGQVIIDYFGNGESLGVNIIYVEEKEPLGTVGGVKEIEDQLNEDFIVFYGDVMINMDLNRLIRFHQNKNSECTLVVHPNNHPYDSDLVELGHDGRITNILSKNKERDAYYSNMVNAGAYIFSSTIFKFLEKGKKADFGRDIFPKIYKQTRMFGYNTAEYLKDMGTHDRLEEVEKDLLSGKIERLNMENKRSAIFLDRDGVINHEISFIHKPDQFKLYDFTANAIKKINQSEYLSIVITNQSVIARNLCTLEELSVIHKKMETELGQERAKLDAIYFCPHHPDKGYPEERAEYKIDCECRKPKPGMLLDAARDFNIDLSTSYMIGDSERDIVAGKRAGCMTIGVRGGHALKKLTLEPDYIFENLKEATDFIVDEPFKKIVKEIQDKLSKITENPAIIAIGGNTRSGKTTLASYLKYKLGKKVLHIKLDNWLLPKEKRKENFNVYDRFQLEKIESDIEKLLKGESLKIKKYITRENDPETELTYNSKGHEIVLIEGVVALGSKKLRNKSHIKLHMHAETSRWKERMYNYYYWRGKNDDYIEKLITARTNDEYVLVEKLVKFADIVINN